MRRVALVGLGMASSFVGASGGCTRLDRVLFADPAGAAAPVAIVRPAASAPEAPLVAAPLPDAPPPASAGAVASGMIESIAPAASAVAPTTVASAGAPALASARPAEVSEAAPDPLEAGEDAPPPSGPELVALFKETWIYAEPSFKGRKLGYLRAGAKVGRGEKPAGFAGCEKGWYRVSPRGFVCVGQAATLNLDHLVGEMARRPPERRGPLPYAYGMSRFPTPPLYLKLPSPEEQRSVESDLDKHLRASKQRAAPIPEDDLDPIPGSLLYGRVVPPVTPNRHGPGALYAGRAVAKSGFAFVSRFEWEGRTWGLTTDFHVVPLDRTRAIEPSAFHGLAVGESGLPVVFVRSKAARYYRRDATSGAVSDDGAIAYREGVPIIGKPVKVGALSYVEARDGRLLRDKDLVRLDAPKEWPSFALEGKKWIDISILRQSLVAYEGQKPVYATLVSTGADGLGDPKETHSTVRGAFLIHTKHVSVTMDSDEADDRFDLRDVPFVQYFHEGYALHAAYWHDDFGRPKSHGCVNLHPTDAAWLFAWTDPEVPDAWHSAMTLKQGTTVYIHP